MVHSSQPDLRPEPGAFISHRETRTKGGVDSTIQRVSMSLGQRTRPVHACVDRSPNTLQGLEDSQGIRRGPRILFGHLGNLRVLMISMNPKIPFDSRTYQRNLRRVRITHHCPLGDARVGAWYAPYIPLPTLPRWLGTVGLAGSRPSDPPAAPGTPDNLLGQARAGRSILLWGPSLTSLMNRVASLFRWCKATIASCSGSSTLPGVRSRASSAGPARWRS